MKRISNTKASRTAAEREEYDRINAHLDQALELTFPCSDPVAITINGYDVFRREAAIDFAGKRRSGISDPMSEEDDPLARDGNWRRLSVFFDPRAMEQMGPNLEVSIAAVTETGGTLAAHEVCALIDTGSKSSCISPRLAPKMEGGLRGVRAACRTFTASLKVPRRSEA